MASKGLLGSMETTVDDVLIDLGSAAQYHSRRKWKVALFQRVHASACVHITR